MDFYFSRKCTGNARKLKEMHENIENARMGRFNRKCTFIFLCGINIWMAAGQFESAVLVALVAAGIPSGS